MELCNLNQSREAVLDELVARLGNDFGQDLFNLRNAYLNVHVEWRFYRSMFGTNPERVELLNSCSGIFAVVLEKTLFESVILTLCRLLDPVEMGHPPKTRRNMTLQRLTEYMDGEIRIEYESKLDVLKEQSGFARDWRNRRIAHSDYYVSSGSANLEAASRAKVQTVLDLSGDLLVFVYERLLDTHLVLDPILSLEDEMRVLRLLHSGLQLEASDKAARKAAISEGSFERFPNREVPDWLASSTN